MNEFGESVVHLLRKSSRTSGVGIDLYAWRVEAEDREVDTCGVHVLKTLLDVGEPRVYVAIPWEVGHECVLGFLIARHREVLCLAPVAIRYEVLLDSDLTFRSRAGHPPPLLVR